MTGEYIKCAAILLEVNQNQCFTGTHHGECLKKLKNSYTQGFIARDILHDTKFRFVDRKEALKIAIEAGQKIQKHPPLNELLSEDLYQDERYDAIARLQDRGTDFKCAIVDEGIPTLNKDDE